MILLWGTLYCVGGKRGLQEDMGLVRGHRHAEEILILHRTPYLCSMRLGSSVASARASVQGLLD